MRCERRALCRWVDAPSSYVGVVGVGEMLRAVAGMMSVAYKEIQDKKMTVDKSDLKMILV